jgi:hypothetical protein
MSSRTSALLRIRVLPGCSLYGLGSILTWGYAADETAGEGVVER